ncbi:MAG: HD domain-containing protein [Candidatus Diapherotrites archaeon]|nr:HD domain-containing protein [Candidatus Diapherotrites archaeon]
MQPIKCKDIVYGNFEIKEPVLIELYNSVPIQRLKGISQWLPDRFDKSKTFTRFEHSIGVMALLDRLDASLEERIAGLIHDVSHTAFSHAIDHIVGREENEDYQDRIFAEFVKKTEIPEILEKHGFGIEQFTDLTKFTLLEKEIPYLCADRVDYTLKQIVLISRQSQKAKQLLNGLVNFQNTIQFDSLENAKEFGLAYLKFQTENWASEKAVAKGAVMTEIMNEALQSKALEFEDFFQDDDFVLGKLEKSKNPKIIEGLEKIRTENLSPVKKPKKLRYVDPTFLENGKIKRVSKEDKEFHNMIEELKKNHKDW